MLPDSFSIFDPLKENSETIESNKTQAGSLNHVDHFIQTQGIPSFKQVQINAVSPSLQVPQKTQLDQNKLAEILNDLDEQTHALRPFFNFFSHLINQIGRLFNFLFFPAPDYLNHEILSQLVHKTSGNEQGSRSLLLSYAYKQIKQQNEQNVAKGDKKDELLLLEPLLKNAADWAYRLESLQNTPKLKANSRKIRELIKEWTDQTAHLKTREKILIPGGWQQEEGTFSQALYEVEKQNDGLYTIRVLSLETSYKEYWAGEKNLDTEKVKYNPLLEFKDVSLEKFEDSLFPLIAIQLPQTHQLATEKNRGYLGERMHTIRRLFSDSSPNTKTSPLTALEIMAHIYKSSPTPSNQHFLVSTHSSSSFSKIFFNYLKAFNPDHYQATKLHFQLSAFFGLINQEMKALLTNPHLRQLSHSAARRLLYQIEKHPTRFGLEEKDREAVVLDLKKVIVLCQKLDAKEQKWAAPSVQVSEFEDSFKMTPLLSLETASPHKQKIDQKQGVEFKSLEIVVSHPNSSLRPNSQRSLTLLKEQLKQAQELYTKENYDSLEALLLHTTLQLPSPLSSFWEAIPPSDRTQWHEAFFELSQFFFDCHQLRGGILTPEKVVAQANLLALSDRLLTFIANDHPADSYFAIGDNEKRIVYFDPSEIKKVFTEDPYFRLIDVDQHQLAQDLLEYWNTVETSSSPRAPISLDDLSNFIDVCNLKATHGSNPIPPQADPDLQAYIEKEGPWERAYLFGCIIDKKLPDQWDSIYKLFGELEIQKDKPSLLPPPIVQQHKMHLMMKGLLSHQHLFSLENPKDLIAAGDQMVSEAGGNTNALSQEEMWQRLWKIQDKKAAQTFKTSPPPLDPTTKQRLHIQWSMNSDGHFLLHPTKLRFDQGAFAGWKKWHSNKSFYKETGRAIDSNTDQMIVSFELGTENKSKDCLTQQALINRSSSEEEQLLRSMQTGSSRLEQTFATFSEHPELLDSLSNQRLFELNLFKQGELLKKIKDQPSFAKELLDFTHNQFILAHGIKNIPRALFFIQLDQLFRDYIASALSEKSKTEIFFLFPATSEPYQKLLKIATTDQEKQMISTQQLVDYAQQIEKGTLDLHASPLEASAELLMEIVQSYFLVKNINSGNPSQNPDWDQKIDRLMSYLRQKFKSLCNDPIYSLPLFLKLFNVLHLPPPNLSNLERKFPYVSFGNQSIDFDKGLIFTDQKANGLLPKEVFDDEQIQKLFKNKKTGECQLKGPIQIEFKKENHAQQEVALYTFTEHSHIRILLPKNGKPIVHMKRKDCHNHWCELLSFDSSQESNKKTKNPQDLPGEMADLVINRFVWRDLEHPTHLIVTEENELSPVYEIHLKKLTEDWQLKKVRRCKDGRFLLPFSKDPSLLGSLAEIEALSHIKAWGTGSKIEEIEFPRIKMPDGRSLTYHIRQGKNVSVLESAQFSDFILSSQSFPLILKKGKEEIGTELLPASFKQFHLLINRKTQTKKVLIPLQQFKLSDVHDEKESIKMAQWSDQASFDQHPSSYQNQTLLEFEIDPIKHNLKSEHKQSNLFLAYLFFTHKRYEQALHFLELSETSLTLSPSHRRLYDWIHQWPDQTPEGNAFKLHTQLALKAHEQKQEKNPRPIEQHLLDIQRLIEQFTAYKKLEPSLSHAMRLTQNEKDLYDRLIHQTFLPAVKNSPLATPTVAIPPTPWKTPSIFKKSDLLSSDLLAKELFLEMSGSKLNEEAFTLKADTFFVQGFLGLYQALYEMNPNSAKYRQLKQKVELARPSSAAAKSLQLLLMNFIKIKEPLAKNWDKDKDALKDFAFPKTFTQPYFKFARIAVVANNKNHPSLTILKTWLEQLESLTDKETLASEEAKSKEKVLPSNKKEFVPSELKIFITGREITHLSQLKMPSESNPSFEETIQFLHKTRQLEEIAQNRHLAELEHQKNLVDDYLTAHPVSVAVPDQSSPLSSSEQVLIHEPPLSHIFNLQSSQTTPQGKMDRVNAVFEDYLTDDSVPEHVQSLVKEYLDDTRYFIEHHQTTHVSLQPTASLSELKTMVEKTQAKTSDLRIKTEEQLFILLSSGPQSPGKDVLSPRFKTIPQRLIGLYLDHKMSDVNRVLGLSLSDQEIKQLEKQIEVWMVSSIQERIANRAVDQIREMTTLTDLSPEALYELVSPTRYFGIGKQSHLYSRELLAIEFSTGFILRKNQVKTIETMLNDPNQVKQLGMGEGKSSVILPMLLHRLADGNKLAMGILPEWLYEIVAMDLDKNSRALFGQEIIKFEFDRNTKMDEEWLLHHYVSLAEAIKNRSALVTTKTFLLSFRNKFLETLQELTETKDPEEERVLNKKIELMAALLTLFKERGAAIADEVDTILDVRQELNYAIGLPDHIDEKKWQMGLQIYRKLLQTPALSTQAARLKNNEQSLFSKEESKKLRQDIATLFFEEWKTTLSSANLSISKDLFCDYVIGETRSNLPLINDLPVFMHTLKEKEQTKELYEKIALLRQYLKETLTTTLSNSGDVHYGRANDGENTIPYQASNTPSEAEFGEEFERIGYFIQNYIQKGLSEKQVASWINKLLVTIHSEMQNGMVETGTLTPFKNTPSYRHFHQEFPHVDLAKLTEDPTQFYQFLKELNTNEDTILHFLEIWIFPSLKIPYKQVSSNAYDLVNMVHDFGGFTGTPHNKDYYHHKINTKEAKTKGTEGKSIALLMDLLEKGELNIHVIDIDSKAPLSSILNHVPDFIEKYDAFIDAGYYLKGINNESVVEHIGKQNTTNKKGVAYVTQDNEKVIQTFEKDDKQPLQNRKDIKMNERLTYYDQAHTIGTDIPHTQTARASLTIGENMYIKDLLQAMWRMRKLDKGQTIDLIISQEIKKRILAARPAKHPSRNSPRITLQDILLFCMTNQAHKGADNNLCGQRLFLNGFMPDTLFWQLVNVSRSSKSILEAFFGVASNGNNKKELFKQYGPFLLKTTANDIDRLAKVSSRKPSSQVLNDLKNQSITTYETLQKNLIEPDMFSLKEPLRVTIGKSIKQLSILPLLQPDKLPKETESVSNETKGSQVQIQQQQQQQQQMSIQTEQGNTPIDLHETWNAWQVNDLEDLWNAIETMRPIDQEVPFLSKDVRITPNFSPENSHTKQESLAERLVSKKRIPVTQVLVIQNTLTGEWRTVLMDLKDYEKVVSKLMIPSTNPQFKAAIFDVRPQKGSLLLRSTAAFHDCPWQENEMQVIRETLVKIKVFNRQMNFYNRYELRALKEWVKKERSVIQDYFEKFLLLPTLQQSYPNSTLGKALKTPNN